MKDQSFHLTLLRHGESEGNARGVIQGQDDYPLSDKGRQQVEALQQRWLQENRQFDRILTSPLARARETAEILAPAFQLQPAIDEVWMERDFGKISGQAVELIPATEIQEPFLHPYQPVGEIGESILQFYLRGGQALQSILQGPAGRYLIAAHGGILNMVLFVILGITPMPNFLGPQFSFRNAAFATAIYHPENHRWRVLGIDDQRHWEDSEASTNTEK